jgi:hypothetical protein
MAVGANGRALITMIADKRYIKAMRRVYELAAAGKTMGLAVHISAGEYQVPRRWLARRLRGVTT